MFDCESIFSARFACANPCASSLRESLERADALTQVAPGRVRVGNGSGTGRKQIGNGSESFSGLEKIILWAWHVILLL